MFMFIRMGFHAIVRDKANLFFIVLFPSLLVFMLGNLLAFLDNPDEAINPMEIRYTIQTENVDEVAAIDAFLEAFSEIDQITFVEAEDFDAVKEAVRSENASAGILFTEPIGIEIFEGSDSIQNRAVKLIFKGYARQAGALTAIAQTAPERLPETVDAIFSGAGGLLADHDLGYSRTMLDYYAVTMIVMIIFMGSTTGGAEDLFSERKNHTLARIIASPKNRTNIYIQKVIAQLPQNLMQTAIVMIVSIAVFHVHYADTFRGNLLLMLMLILAGMAVSALFMILGMILKFNPTAIIMPLAWVILFISGTFSKEVSISGFTEYSPAFLIQSAAFDLTVFGRDEKCLIVIVICVAVLILSTVAGALLFRRKGFAV
ncbi:MAG: ABC transporter permease [Clostridiales Family XIII bacterium]|jgi:ABC-2 type transport system permease protein|nr:ABC transporter permease [Clostridiales Family XIII bacterium]